MPRCGDGPVEYLHVAELQIVCAKTSTFFFFYFGLLLKAATPGEKKKKLARKMS